MENNFWQYWTLQTNAKGQQRWQFTPPTHITDFNTAEGQKFLADMQQSFLFNKTANANSADKVYRSKCAGKNYTAAPASITESAERAFEFYSTLQTQHGFFPGDYGGPHFLLPGLIIASCVTESALPAPHIALMKQYMLNHQNADGGWGLHLEDTSTMFGSVLQYVALRLLGIEANDAAMQKAQQWILKNGGATHIPSWGKFYLSVLGVYEWEGCNSLFPEMWLLPDGLPFHPSNYWCHARMVYLPMAYCFGLKLKGKTTPVVNELRKEIYNEPYGKINWTKARNQCAATDLYHHPSPLLHVLNAVTNTYEKIAPAPLRKKAVDFILQMVNAEDEQTNYINIGPVNQAINSIVVWHAYGKDSKQFKSHYNRWFDYLWVAEDGMKMNGYNGSQFWDTCFAVQAALEYSETNNSTAVEKIIADGYPFIHQSQITEEARDYKKFYRHASLGGWPFSTVEHSWPITDCTAEGLKTTIQIHEELPSVERNISDDRLKQAADLLISFQNRNGGWASYELTRAGNWLEMLNPSEIFGNIMIDYYYTECSSACIQGLVKFGKAFPDYRKNEVDKAIAAGIRFILSQQKADGSWYGSWAVCFTYGTWFALEGLAVSPSIISSNELSKATEKACSFLLSKQNSDGGWGEKFDACLKKEYVADNKSQVINTAWALLALMKAGCKNTNAVKAGIDFLVAQQNISGDFPQQNISGVFNHSCGITYTAYRNVFPAWALARYTQFSGAQ